MNLSMPRLISFAFSALRLTPWFARCRGLALLLAMLGFTSCAWADSSLDDVVRTWAATEAGTTHFASCRCQVVCEPADIG